jgi:hypothetical protein
MSRLVVVSAMRDGVQPPMLPSIVHLIAPQEFVRMVELGQMFRHHLPLPMLTRNVRIEDHATA